MFIRIRIYYLLLFALADACATPLCAQGIAGLTQNFGQGTANPATIGNPLLAAATGFTFSNSVCPPEGGYTIVRRIAVGSCFNNEWINLTRDHTPNMDFGMMMLVNNGNTAVTKLVYADTVQQPLCPGIACRFKVAIINVDEPSVCPLGPDFPRFEMRITAENGQLIIKDTTQPVSYASSAFGYKFSEYYLDFTMPAGAGKLVAKLSVIPGSYLCAEDFAIDDFTVMPLGPELSVNFTGEPPSNIAKYTCFYNNQVVAFTGQSTPYYTNPALQWQQSTDSGINWQDIPGATSAVYSRTFSTPGKYQFRLTSGEAGNISNPYCRVASGALRIYCDSIPYPHPLSTNTPICAGEQLQLNANGGAAYEWFGPNNFYDNVAGAQIFNTQLKDSGMYYATIISTGGCRAYDSIRVVIRGTDVSAGPDTAICQDEFAQLHASGGISVHWQPVTGLSAANVFSPKAAPAVTTTYMATVTDRFGCTGAATVTVRLRNVEAVKAAIEANGFLCRPYDSIWFNGSGQGIIKNWLWNFDNGRTDTLKNPAVQYYQVSSFQNNYRVQLTVTDTAGCTATAVHTLTAVDNCRIGVATAFTPNNDGVNDELFPLNAYKPKRLIFRVYNRMGQLVFSSTGYAARWNGTYAGLPQPAGVYVWMLEFEETSGKKVFEKGTTILLR